MGRVWDMDTVKRFLPQRYPFLFIDRVLAVNETESKVSCLKNFTVNEWFFQGHFPEKPIVPGAIIIEAMAQAGIILYAVLKPHLAERNPDYYLGKVKIKFMRPVCAGDSLILEVQSEKMLEKTSFVKAYAKVKEEIIAEAEIVFAIKLKR